jgi:hypothetical protein
MRGHAGVAEDEYGSRVTVRAFSGNAGPRGKAKNSSALLLGSIGILLAGLAFIYLLVPSEYESVVAPLSPETSKTQTSSARPAQADERESIDTEERDAQVEPALPASSLEAKIVSDDDAHGLPTVSAPAVQAADSEPALAGDVASDGIYAVQLLASQHEEAILRAREEALRRYNGLLDGHPLVIEEADLGERGRFLRLRAKGFATREAAGALCGAVKTRGGDCIVVTH